MAEPFADLGAAARWLKQAGESDLERDLRILNRALHHFRLVTADPYLNPVGRSQALVARVGYGAGDEVADGRWSDAQELLAPVGRERRAQALQPQARLAAVIGQKERALVCEELSLRAHLDVDADRPREAALQVLVALDAALAELSVDPLVEKLDPRLTELRGQRDAVTAAAQAALAGELSDEEREAVVFTLGRIEAALRFRAANQA